MEELEAALSFSGMVQRRIYLLDGHIMLQQRIRWLLERVVANASTFGDATHTHSYSQATGGSGSHTHAISVSIGQPINATVPGHYSGGTKNAEWADRYHTNHSSSVTVSLDSGHIHSLGNTGGAANIPPAFGLYFIRKT